MLARGDVIVSTPFRTSKISFVILVPMCRHSAPPSAARNSGQFISPSIHANAPAANTEIADADKLNGRAIS
ncbi:MAG: hypothetical protein HDKAJFGB_02253 [Anaerolineae bacterium]|nr:hypothetical protein [Anaerolineae bacterium]